MVESVFQGVALEQKGEYKEADKSFKDALVLDNKNVEARLYLAEAYQSVGKSEQAIKVLEQAKSLAGNPDLNREIDLYIQKLKNS